MAESTITSIISGLRAAGEPTRLRLLKLLTTNELTVTELTQILGQSQPRVSRHLKLLAEARLVERLREGTWAFYRLADPRRAVNGAEPSSPADEPGLAELLIDLIPDGDPVIARDQLRLDAVKAARAEAAAVYFQANAPEWDRIRGLHLDEAHIEAAMIDVVAPMKVADLIDLGTGTARVLEVLSAYVERGVGVDLSREMLTVARANLESSGTHNCHVRQGDILSLPFPDPCADLVTIHQVLHYLGEPGKAVGEAGRLLRPHGHLLIVDFTPHDLEFLRTEHAHRRLGFSDAEVRSWCKSAGLTMAAERELPPDGRDAGRKLTVKLWLARRAGAAIASRRRARA